MRPRTRVDVVMPAHNSSRFIGEAIESVLSQSYGELELFVVEDDSSDGTGDVIRAFSDSRLRHLTGTYGGPSAARNAALRSSTAPLVAFLDADDRWKPDKLASQVDLMRRLPEVGLVHGFQETIDADGRVIGHLEGGLEGNVFDTLLRGNLVTGSASIVLVRREAFERLGLFREDLFVAEDWEMWLRLASTYDFSHVPEVLVSVRVHERGLQQNRLVMAEGRVRMYSEALQSYDLSRRQRARFARACLTPSVYDYALSGQPNIALATYARLLAANPLALAELKSFRFYLWIVVMALKARRGRP